MDTFTGLLEAARQREWVIFYLGSSEEVVRAAKARIAANLGKFRWHGVAQHQQVMSDEGIFAQVDYILNILHDQMQALPRKPEFRNWVRMDLLPAQ